MGGAYGWRNLLHTAWLSGLRDSEKVSFDTRHPFRGEGHPHERGAMRELIEDLHSHATPTLVLGKQVIVGFGPGKYEGALRSFER